MTAILIIRKDSHVAPTGSRLYRRLAIGQRLKNGKRAASPRYSRLPVGATSGFRARPSSEKKSTQSSWFLSRSSARAVDKVGGSTLSMLVPPIWYFARREPFLHHFCTTFCTFILLHCCNARTYDQGL